MQILRVALLSFCAFMMQPAMADEIETTLDNFRTAGAGDFIDEAYGYAIFPSIGKGGIGIGGAHGKGSVYRGGEQTGTVKMNQITTALGPWQAVEQGRAACWPRAPMTAPSASGTCSTLAARTAAAHRKIKVPTADMSCAGVCLLS